MCPADLAVWSAGIECACRADDRSLRDRSGQPGPAGADAASGGTPRSSCSSRWRPSSAITIDGFFDGNRFPLIEPTAATFVYRGEADAVYLRRWMHGETDGLPLDRLDGTDLWHLRVPVPKGARLEYKFDVVRDGAGAWINDPLNPEVATDPFGANSVCQSLRLRDPGMEPAGPVGSGRQDRRR